MQPLSITYEYIRPNSTIPWHYEFIEKSKDPQLSEIRKEYFTMRLEDMNGKTGWLLKYENHPTDPHIMYMKHYIYGSTEESIDHQGFLYNLKYGYRCKKFVDWAIEYNRQHGITKRRMEFHTNRNSIIDERLESLVIVRSQQLGRTPGFLLRTQHTPEDCK